MSSVDGFDGVGEVVVMMVHSEAKDSSMAPHDSAHHCNRLKESFNIALTGLNMLS